MYALNTKKLLGIGLVMVGLSSGLGAAQHDTDTTCCLADEWTVESRMISPQQQNDFCCVANEWNLDAYEAPSTIIERAVQSDDITCCIANDWHAS